MTRVLVIDDDASLRFTLEAVLSDAGFTVETANGGAAGLTAFDARGADLVLTDLAMPDVDGMQVLARMRASDPSVPRSGPGPVPEPAVTQRSKAIARQAAQSFAVDAGVPASRLRVPMTVHGRPARRRWTR